jgi:hypothetical protein
MVTGSAGVLVGRSHATLHDAAVLGYLPTFSPGGRSSVSGFTEPATPMAERWPARYVRTGAGSTARRVGHRARSVDLSALTRRRLSDTDVRDSHAVHSWVPQSENVLRSR